MIVNKPLLFLFSSIILFQTSIKAQVASQWVYFNNDHLLEYKKDSVGNKIPDFSIVGYHKGVDVFPQGKIVATYNPNGKDDTKTLQALIDSIAAINWDNKAVPKVIILKKGNYFINTTLTIASSGIILRGEGEDEKGTVIQYTATTQSNLFNVGSKRNLNKNSGKEQQITDTYVPVGTFQIHVKKASAFNLNQQVLLTRIPNNNWIHALDMDNIQGLREGSKNWDAKGFVMSYERSIVAIDTKNNLVTLDAPIVMALDKQFDESFLTPYTVEGGISEVGIENLRMVSSYVSETDENHGWSAIEIRGAENCWVNKVTAVHFGFGCVHITNSAKWITVANSTCLDPISQITGGRRYSFDCDGQLCLVKNCVARNGRHDFVTGARVCGPNAFVNCTATQTHADIGPHHRWSTGILYDNIQSDGAMNAQDRGNWGSGHGWSGAYQVFWNCTAPMAAIQNPPNTYNWNIGFTGENKGSKLERQNGVWEAQNAGGVLPKSLYETQLSESKKQ